MFFCCYSYGYTYIPMYPPVMFGLDYQAFPKHIPWDICPKICMRKKGFMVEQCWEILCDIFPWIFNCVVAALSVCRVLKKMFHLT